MGLSTDEQQAVKKIITKLITATAMFTSVDISNKVKSELQLWIRNRDIARTLSGLVTEVAAEIGVNYRMSDITVTTSGAVSRDVIAKLYHPTTTDPDGYQTRNLRALSPAESNLSVSDPSDGASASVVKTSVDEPKVVPSATKLASKFKFPV